MKLIVGLGNPGPEYEDTRHNVGFMVVEALGTQIKNSSAIFQMNSKFKAQIAQTNNLTLLKPQTFMNRSGVAVRSVVNFYKLPLTDVYIIHDDLDIRLGEYKIKFGTGPKVHNGLNSVREQLGSDEFWHVRIGVDNRTADSRMSGERYVLSTFTEEERSEVLAVIDKVVREMTEIIGLGR